MAANVDRMRHAKPPTKEEESDEIVTDRKGFGRVPLYIHKRKQELADAKQRRREEKQREKLAPGMVLMSDEERLKTVALLETNEKSIVDELRNMPLRVETHSLIEKQRELHEKLEEIEQALKLFRRQKVYIKADM